jgi:hypothetical protein
MVDRGTEMTEQQPSDDVKRTRLPEDPGSGGCGCGAASDRSFGIVRFLKVAARSDEPSSLLFSACPASSSFFELPARLAREPVESCRTKNRSTPRKRGRCSENSPRGAVDCSPRRKPGVVETACQSPGGATEPAGRTAPLSRSFFRPYRGWICARVRSPGLGLGLPSDAPPGNAVNDFRPPLFVGGLPRPPSVVVSRSGLLVCLPRVCP